MAKRRESAHGNARFAPEKPDRRSTRHAESGNNPSLLNMPKRLTQLIATLLLLSIPLAATASCCDGVGTADWDGPGEVLEYHSCGCADACWVAEVRHRKTQRLKARLRCDCEKAYFSVGPSKIGGPAEQVFENSCTRFEQDDKFAAINKALKRILKRPSNARPAPSTSTE